MKDYTIRFTEENNKVKALIDYLKSLEFVELSSGADWWDEISEKNKASIKRGLDDLKNGKTFTDDDVRTSIRKQISSAKSS